MPRTRVRQELDQSVGRWSAEEGAVRVTCAGCGQPIAPVDEPLMLRVEGELPGERQSFHARCWVWWTESRRLERAGIRLRSAQQPSEALEAGEATWTAGERYQFPDSER